MSFETPDNLAEFYDRVESAIPATEREEFASFRREAEGRHEAGKGIFGDAYLRRNNPREGQEEASDGGNYSCYDTLRWRAESHDDEDPALALLFTAARHFYLAHKALSEVPGKRAGGP